MKDLELNQLKELNGGNPGPAYEKFWGPVNDFIDGFSDGMSEGIDEGWNSWSNFVDKYL